MWSAARYLFMSFSTCWAMDKQASRRSAGPALSHRSAGLLTALPPSGKGLTLRILCIVGFIRDDKSPEDTTTVKEIAEMFAQQTRSSNQRG